MEVNWLVEDFERDGSLDPFISEIKLHGMRCEVIKCFPFDDGRYDCYKDDEIVIFYGSLNSSKQIQRKKQWIPGSVCNSKNLCCLTYYSHWGKYLFNKNYIMLPLSEVGRRREEIYDQFGVDGCIFMRPNSGSKTFCGSVYSIESLDSELKIIDNYSGLPLDEILVIISSPKFINREWRVVVSSKYGAVASSMYKKNGEIYSEEGSPQEVIEIANKIAMDEWQPDRMYVVDICESNGDFHFLEVNSFSCSGFYKCNPKPIIEIASILALEEWKDYQEL